MKNLPLVLIILDGFGVSKKSNGNASAKSKMFFWKSLLKQYPNTLLSASGTSVGLPKWEDGNSEAGHINLGAGRVVSSDSVRISESIGKGSFFHNPAFSQALAHARQNNSNLHLMGMLPLGQSAHAEIDHLLALLKYVELRNFRRCFLHLFTDGRDSPPSGALDHLNHIQQFFPANVHLSSISGRFYAMDRKKAWERTQKVYDMLTLGKAILAPDGVSACANAYVRGESDEYIYPTLILNKQEKMPPCISDNDSVIFFNLRSDRARQLTKPFVQKDFEKDGGFKRTKKLKNLCFVSLTDFGPYLDHVISAFPAQKVQESLTFMLRDFLQLYIAESEKFAHITYFFNGGYTNTDASEERIMIPSPKVSDYTKTPAMKVPEITDIIIKKLVTKKYDFIATNFSSPDMIGHTGNLKAAIVACESVDKSLKKIAKEVIKQKGTLIITADHGNVEEMIANRTHQVDTKHSSNKVPFVIMNNDLKKIHLKKNGKLANVAPTILKIMSVKKSPFMTSSSLF